MPSRFPNGYKHPPNAHVKAGEREREERLEKSTAELAAALTFTPLAPHPCKERCQYAIDIGMPEHSCSDGCMYDRVHGEE